MTSAVALIARREITTRYQQRGYRIGLGIALLVVVLGCTLPALFRGDDGPARYDVGVAAGPAGITQALTATARSADVTVTVHRVDAADARGQVRNGHLDAALLPGGRLVVRKSGDGVVRVVQGAYQLAGTVDRLRRAGLSAPQASRALAVAPLSVSATESSSSGQRQAIAIITIVVLFSQLVTFCTWVATGVVEEKASRVVELILSSVRPLQLLAGKLLGIGTVAVGQVLALGVVAVVSARAADTLTVPGSAITTVVVAFVGFVLGYAFFAALAAALGSTVSRQEEVSGVLTPVTLTVTVCYFASFTAANSPDTTFARVISVVPPFSSFAMPARIARGGVSALDVVLAVVLLVVAAGAMLVVAARIYRASILHSGTRVSLRRAWRGEAVADIS